MIVHLRDDFTKAWQGRDPFAQVEALNGEVFRSVKGRRTLRFEFEGRRYFVKIHRGVGWAEIFKNLLSLKLPVLGAENEWSAIAKLQECGVKTMNTVGYGSRGCNPATRHSFIITEALEDTISLEDYCAPWLETKPPFMNKVRLLAQVASVSKIMHGAGMCHRDYYICHFLLHDAEEFTCGKVPIPQLSLIDLHRAFTRRRPAQRWLIKDIAGLYFSALHIGLSQRDLLRFVRIYSGQSIRATLKHDAKFWQQVQKRAQQLDKKHNHS